MNYKQFELQEQLTKEQIQFFHHYGFIHFKNVFDQSQVYQILEGLKELQTKILAENITEINGVPVKIGYDLDNSPILQRTPFTSLHVDAIKSIAEDTKITALKQLFKETDTPRLAQNEMDGVVFNHYVNAPKSHYKNLGWHTDSARDFFYGKKMELMLNIGIYLDDSSEVNGGLRILPQTHNKGIWTTLFRKTYFLSNSVDKKEVLVKAKAGDVVVHDGRLWHRVGQAPEIGEASRRRILYMPMITGVYKPKDANSKMALYHHFMKFIGK